MTTGSRWAKVTFAVPTFKTGAPTEYATYFERPSTVEVHSIADVCNWLLGCEYASDEEQFGVAEHWMHPSEFEATRKGDCEDHALWAWRKLVELGLDAEFVVGRCPDPGDPAGEHAWVIIHDNDGLEIFEATAKSVERMRRRVQDAGDHYLPHYGVDGEFRIRPFVGLLDDMRPKPAPPPDESLKWSPLPFGRRGRRENVVSALNPGRAKPPSRVSRLIGPVLMTSASVAGIVAFAAANPMVRGVALTSFVVVTVAAMVRWLQGRGEMSSSGREMSDYRKPMT